MADPQIGSEGLANLAHAIRRSVALHVAMSVSEVGTTDEQLLARADKYAAWINGHAGAAQQAQQAQFMGANPWENQP